MIGSIRFILPCILILALTAETTSADVITLKDGGRLRCEVLEDDEDSDFVRIRIGGGSILLRRDIVSRIEYAPEDRPTATPQDQDLLQRLIDAGDAITGADGDAPPQTTGNDDSEPLIVKSIRGWAYSGPAGRRVLLQEGDAIPRNQVIQVSPNSRVTLEIRDTGLVGLTGGAEIRFDRIHWERTVQSYSIDARLLHGTAWFKIGTDEESWQRVVLTINAVNSIFQNATLVARAGQRSGEAYITYLEGQPRQSFRRQTDGPYTINIGQTIHANPGSNTLGIFDLSETPELMQTVRDWDDWSPEPLLVELKSVLPPLDKFSLFGVLPALHPHYIPIDDAITYPVEDRSLGEILKAYKDAISRYRADTGRYPSQEAGLDALERPMGVAGWRGPYIDARLPRKDPWGSNFVYELFDDDGQTVVSVRSLGPNRMDEHGLGDDIR